jgi:hypothetical protein
VPHCLGGMILVDLSYPRRSAELSWGSLVMSLCASGINARVEAGLVPSKSRSGDRSLPSSWMMEDGCGSGKIRGANGRIESFSVHWCARIYGRLNAWQYFLLLRQETGRRGVISHKVGYV